MPAFAFACGKKLVCCDTEPVGGWAKSGGWAEVGQAETLCSAVDLGEFAQPARCPTYFQDFPVKYTCPTPPLTYLLNTLIYSFRLGRLGNDLKPAAPQRV
jgi:hypothetical protein